MAPATATARRVRVRERARHDILESSARVFARRGFAAATLAELAEAAGYAPPSLYRYFRSKEEIFESLLALVSREIEEVFEAPVDRTLPIAARLEGLLTGLGQLAAGRGEILELLSAQVDEGARCARLEELIAGWLRRNVSRRELRFPQAVVAGVMAGILLSFRHGPDRLGGDPAGRAQLAADLILHGVSA
ncbi:MAG TPA: helix-turn-helix domain-containing protein [Anaeromyxobacteraceae bacterium]|nr:helix-turn-helix domain-containing protein [Anaeromyxobacteraceae bacterium]